VTLYQERLQELQTQHASGALDDAQLQQGRDEAARELLADTEGAEAQRKRGVLGRKIPFAAALLMPVLGGALYLHWGALDELQRARDFAGQPQSIEAMTARLEANLENNPESAEGWYFLGRTYMAQDRAGDAAQAFERAIGIAGRAPELLGQWAQALYFAGNKQWNAQLQALTEEALQADPEEVTTLGLLGIAAYEEGRYQVAVDYWQRLVDVLPVGDPSRQAIEGGIARAQQELGQAETPEKLTEEAAHRLQIEVQLAPELLAQVQADDSVFVFARAVSGPTMPLAVKRLRVADLPAQVSLSDSDAMMPQLKLSAFEQVELVARVSRAGNATAGEWIGRSQPLPSNAREPQQLLIDQVDSPAP